MTDGMWKCKKCNHEIRCGISSFFEKCLECNAEYEKLAVIHGFHIAHDITFYKLKEDPIDKWQMIEPFALARDTSIIPTVICYSEEYYNNLKQDKKYNHLNIKMVKING